MNRITMLPVAELRHHPKNPRLELGDLSELAESIRARGVMQNLTVVPVGGEDEGYYVVIGNRRLDAAKMAGVTELPCVISDMDEKEQMSTMVLENMQRSDLTVYEQAMGFQQMLDLGMTEKEIGEKTGFSESTVRRRVKLCRYDKEKFKEACERGATLMDWAELEKIEDPKRREKLVDALGTNNFKWELTTAIGHERDARWMAEFLPQVTPWAKEMPKDAVVWRDYESKGYYSVHNTKQEQVVVPEDAAEKEYFYNTQSGNSIGIYTRKESADAEEEEDEEKINVQLRQEARAELMKKAYSLREAFVKAYEGRKADRDVLISDLLDVLYMRYGYCAYMNIDALRNVLEVEKPEDNRVTLADQTAGMNPEKRLLALLTVCIYQDKDTLGYIDKWSGAYKESQSLDRLYALLCRLGYQMSDEEKQLQDGTHEIFGNREEDEE